jgi:hypothetical protein
MLKNRVDGAIRLVTQPDHANVAGYLAAHWGGGDFAKPGHYAECPDPEAARAEVIFGIAEHDNGWWEWEADPEIDPADGLPLHFLDTNPGWGRERWSRGVGRFRQSHPYAALLISHHAYWLNAGEAAPDFDDGFIHPLFGSRPGGGGLPAMERRELDGFLDERRADHALLTGSLGASPLGAALTGRAHLYPHVRLLQTLDSLSLSICGGRNKGLELSGVPRGGWDDRVTVSVSPPSGGRIAIEPYPFDEDPLPVFVPARVIPEDAAAPEGPLDIWRRRHPLRTLEYLYTAA